MRARARLPDARALIRDRALIERVRFDSANHSSLKFYCALHLRESESNLGCVANTNLCVTGSFHLAKP